jgi:hypothetical protein
MDKRIHSKAPLPINQEISQSVGETLDFSESYEEGVQLPAVTVWQWVVRAIDIICGEKTEMRSKSRVRTDNMLEKLDVSLVSLKTRKSLPMAPAYQISLATLVRKKCVMV